MQRSRTGRFRRLGAAVLSALTASVGLAAMATTAEATPSFTITRLGSNDRYSTAATIALQSFPGGAETVVVATGENFPDALAANYLAGQRNGPVLLTQASTIPPSLLSALQTLKTRNVLLVGGTTVVAQSVENTLNATASTNAAGGNLVVQRLFGTTRYDTMREIVTNPAAAAVGTIGGRRTAILATGENFADAVSLGSVAWANKFPIILTQPDNLVAQATQAMTALGIQQVLIAGGLVAINASVESAVNAAGVTTLQRFAGTDRSDTSRLAANYAIDTLGFKNSHVNIATGAPVLGGVDALAGGSHGGAEDPTVVLLTNTTADPGALIAFATARASTLTSAHAFGLDGALQQSLLDAFTTAARGLAPSPGNFNVTPGGNLVRTNSSVGTGLASDTQGDTTLTFRNLTGTVDVVLIPCNAYRPAINAFSNSNNNLIADRTNLAGGPAIDLAGTPAQISSVNGSAAGIVLPGADYANNVVVPAGGTLTVVITNLFDLNPGADSPCVRVLVFNDVNNNDALDTTNAGPAPATENFSISGRVQFFPEEAQSGQFNGVADVQAVEKTVNRFAKCVITVNNVAPVLDVVDTNTCTAMDFDANDEFRVARIEGGVFFPVSFAEFQTRISPGDDIFGVYAADPAAPSDFFLLDEAPNPPINFVANAGPNNVLLTWDDSTTPTAEAYNIYRQVDPTPADDCEAPSTIDTLPGTYSLVATVLDRSAFVPGDPPYSYNDQNLTAGTKYCYIIRTVDTGDESINSLIAFATVGTNLGGGAAGAPFWINSFAQDNGLSNVLDGNLAGVPTPDIITLVANEPLADSADDANTTLRARDADGTIVDITCGTRNPAPPPKFTLVAPQNSGCELNQVPVTIQGVNYEVNRVLRITLLTQPFPTFSPGANGPNYPMTITNVSANVQDADQGNTLQIAPNGDNIIEGGIQDPVFGPPSMSAPPVAVINSATVTVTYTEQVQCEGGTATAAQFTVSQAGPNATAIDARCIGNKVILTFGPNFNAADQSLFLTYTQGPAGPINYAVAGPSTGPRIKDLAGNDAVSAQTSQQFTATILGNASDPTVQISGFPGDMTIIGAPIGSTEVPPGFTLAGSDIITTDSTPTFTGTAADTFGGNVVSVEARVDGGAFGDVCTNCPGGPNGTVNFSYTTPALGDGSHTVQFRATDNQGGTATVSFTFTIDASPPVIVAAQIRPGSAINPDEIRLTFNEPVTCPAASASGFAYNDTSFFDDSDDDFPISSVVPSVGSVTCTLRMQSDLQADDFGVLTYSTLLSGAPITNAAGLALAGAAFNVLDTILPRLVNGSVVGGANPGGTTVTVSFFGEDVGTTFDDIDGIRCSTIGVGDLVVTVNGAPEAVTVGCTGIDRTIVLTRVAGTWVAGTVVRITVAGAIFDESGNQAVIGSFDDEGV